MAENFQLQDVQKVPYAFLATDAIGDPASPNAGDSVTIVSSDTDSLTVVPDATPDPAKFPAGSDPIQTGFLVAGKKLQIGVSVTATAKLASGAVIDPVVDLIDVVGGPGVNAGLTLGTPVAQ